MFEELPDILSLVNDVIQAAIVVFGGSVALYNVPHSFRDRVTRAFNSLIFFVIIVFFAELAVTRTTTAVATEVWIRLQWIGIAMVPAAQFHLADALLVTTGDVSRRRRLSVRFWYLTGVTFFMLALFTDLLVNGLHVITHAAHLGPGPLFPVFAVYYWLLSAVSVNMVWRARRRCLTHTTRRRMTMILIAILAAPLAVFPYLLLSQDQGTEISALFWLLLIVGNLTVGIMFSLLTYYIAYFGAMSPDRVVRVRLFKFMARVPLAATIVLLVYVGFSQAGSVLGLRPETALAIFLVLAIVFSEWAIHAFKRPLERVFQLTDEPEVRRIQELSERVLTTRDLHQFLESVLAATCEVLRSPTAFVAAFTADGPQLEAVVGPLEATPEALPEDKWQQLVQPAGDSGGQPTLASSNGFFLWRDYWIRPLLDRSGDLRLGILGVRARSEKPDLSEIESATFERLARLAADALEDRILQQEVFAAVEGLLPQVTELQQRRSAATFGGTNYLIAPADAEEGAGITTDPEFNSMVWDALSHYWGGPKLTGSPLMRLRVVQRALAEQGGNPTNALRDILARAVEQQRPEGERNMTTAEWLLYNILELKFIQGQKVRDVARRLAMSESDLYRKQRVAIENVARTISLMEEAALEEVEVTLTTEQPEAESKPG